MYAHSVFDSFLGEARNVQRAPTIFTWLGHPLRSRELHRSSWPDWSAKAWWWLVAAGCHQSAWLTLVISWKWSSKTSKWPHASNSYWHQKVSMSQKSFQISRLTVKPDPGSSKVQVPKVNALGAAVWSQRTNIQKESSPGFFYQSDQNRINSTVNISTDEVKFFSW